MKHLRIALLRLVAPMLALAAWEASLRLGWMEAHVLPPPSGVVEYLRQTFGDGTLWEHIGVTLLRVAQGFLIGTAVASALGVLTGVSAVAFEMLDPSLQALRSIPSLAWAPLFLIWLGINEISKVTLIAVGVFFPVYLNLAAGIRDVDRKLIEVGRIHGLGAPALIGRIVFPAALPAFLTGLRGGLGLGWMFVVAAELIGASRGLGFLLDFGRNISRPDIILTSILLFAVLGKISDGALVLIEKRALCWQDTLAARKGS